MKTKTKKKGIILLEALFAMILFGMISYGFAATSSLQYQQLSAVKVASQAQQYAEVEAKYLSGVGYTDVDTVGIHDRTSMESLIGEEGWESETKLVATKSLPGDDADNDKKVKVISVDVYKTGESLPRFSLSVPLLSSQDSNTLIVDYESGIINPSNQYYMNFICPDNGVIFLMGNSCDFYLTRKSTTVHIATHGGAEAHSTTPVIVQKGDRITGNANLWLTYCFYPFKK